LFQANIADKEEQSAVIRGTLEIDFDGQIPDRSQEPKGLTSKGVS
jgi:hypothetical protein